MTRKEQPAASDAISILTLDHNNMLRMFDEFRQMQADDEQDDDARQALVERACAELSIHAQVEEEFFYPALRETQDDTLLLDEAQVEHDSARQLVAELEAMQAGDEMYDAKFLVLGEYVRHHIEEEQEKIFRLAKKAKLDLDALGQAILQRKEELRAEFGMLEEGDEMASSRTPGDNGSKRSGRNART